jgi:hypothetical protein
MATPLIATRYATLVANTVTTIDLSSLNFPGGAQVKVITDGASSTRIHFTTDGTTPTVNGNDTWCLLGNVAGWKYSDLGAGRTVKLISTGTPWVGVEVYANY